MQRSTLFIFGIFMVLLFCNFCFKKVQKKDNLRVHNVDIKNVDIKNKAGKLADYYAPGGTLSSYYKKLLDSRKDLVDTRPGLNLLKDEINKKGKFEAFGVREGLEGDKNWKVTIDGEGDLVFNHNGKTVTKITKQGEIVSKKCKCGMWNLRDSRIGIPGRNDMNLHTDGWFRSLNYGAPEITTGRHAHSDYTKGGFAGKELWYGGSIGGRLHRG